jgi:uncharacterized protein YgiM (DUF1202 family)
VKHLAVLVVLLGAILLFGSSRASAQEGDNSCVIHQTVDTDSSGEATPLFDPRQPISSAQPNGWGLVHVFLPGGQQGDTSLVVMGDATLTPVEPEPVLKVVTTFTNANLRAEPSTNGSVVGSATNGTRLNVVAENGAGDWYWVRLESGEHAWVSKTVVVDGAVAEGQPRQRSITTTELAVIHAEASGDSQSLGDMPADEILGLVNVVTDESGAPQWYQVQFGTGGLGWISADSAVRIEDEVGIPTFKLETGASNPGCEGMANGLLVISPAGGGVTINLNGTNVTISGLSIFTTIIPSEGTLPQNGNPMVFGTNVDGSTELAPPGLTPFVMTDASRSAGFTLNGDGNVAGWVSAITVGDQHAVINNATAACNVVNDLLQDRLVSAERACAIVPIPGDGEPDVPGLEDETGADTSATTGSATTAGTSAVAVPTATLPGDSATSGSTVSGTEETFSDAKNDVVDCAGQAAPAPAEDAPADIDFVSVQPAAFSLLPNLPFGDGKIVTVFLARSANQTMNQAYSFAVVLTGRKADGTTLRWLLQTHEGVRSIGQIDQFFNVLPNTQNQVILEALATAVDFNVPADITQIGVEVFYKATPESVRVCDTLPNAGGGLQALAP